MPQNISLGSLPFLDVFGLQLAWVSNTLLTVQAGQARDSNNAIDIVLNAAVSIDATTNGANGLDQGALANNTWYYVYLLGSSLNYAPAAAIVSASQIPDMPEGYDSYRRIGNALTNGSAQFLKFYVYGNSNNRKYFWDALVPVLNGGGSTSFANVDLSISMPRSATLALLNWKLSPATAGNIANLRANGSTSTSNVQLAGSVAAQPNTGVLPINTDALQLIQYKVASGSDALALSSVGFEDFI